MPYELGAEVVVVSLQKRGRIVERAANGRYRVAVGPLAIWCGEAELTTVSQGKKSAKRAREQPTGGGAQHENGAPSEREVRALGRLDLHGMTVEEALRAVQLRLDQAIRAGLDSVEIIHGISGGRLRAAVRGYLAGIGSVARIVPDPHNAGVTRVYF